MTMPEPWPPLYSPEDSDTDPHGDWQTRRGTIIVLLVAFLLLAGVVSLFASEGSCRGCVPAKAKQQPADAGPCFWSASGQECFYSLPPWKYCRKLQSHMLDSVKGHKFCLTR